MEAQKPAPGLWRPYLAVIAWLVIPFVIFVGVGSAVAVYFIFDAPGFLALTYGIVAFLAAGVILFGSNRLYSKAEPDFFLRQSVTADAAERRELSEASMAAMRRQSLLAQTRKNRRTFYQNAIFVAGSLIAIAAAARHFFGLYPQEVFLVSFPILAIIWAVMVLLLPRAVIVVSLLALTGVWLATVALGPEILILLLPYLFIFPLLMLMNVFILFGPLAIFNIMQIKFIRPGEATWGVALDDVRGQEEAKKQVLTTLRMSVSAEGERLAEIGGRAERGTLMIGPPGTGKTLIAKAMATMLNAPIVVTTGSAFMATFMGIDVLVMMFLRMRAEGLAKEFGRAVVFIDEAELLLQRRGGMNALPAPTGSTAGKYDNIWNLFNYDENGCISSCGLMFDNEATRDLFWERKFPRPAAAAPQMMPFLGGMGGGGSMAIFPFLVWLDGMDSPPLFSRMIRSKFNELLDILLVIPPLLGSGNRIVELRLPPAKPPVYNVYFFAATNRPQMIDPAMRRPGRFGKTVVFGTPGETERQDIAELYFSKVTHDPHLDSPERREEFARVAVGLSPAEIEQVIRDAVNYRHDHIELMREIRALRAADKPLDSKTQKYWDRHCKEVEEPGWDTLWVNWESLMEALGALRHGMAKPTRTTERNREKTAYHEFAGHLLPLKYFCSGWQRPIMLSIMPRGEALGMVGHVPIEEHDPQPQRILDGLLRVSVGSIVAERIYFKDNEPGVSRDLENATRIASAMVGLFGMVPRKCSEEDRKRYEKIGESIMSVANLQPAFGGGDPLTAALSSPHKRESVSVLLGQGFVDVYRLLRKNKHLAAPVVAELLRKDEIIGQDLDDLWNTLAIEPLLPSDMTIWPEAEIEPENPFYETDRAGATVTGY